MPLFIHSIKINNIVILMHPAKQRGVGVCLACPFFVIAGDYRGAGYFPIIIEGPY